MNTGRRMRQRMAARRREATMRHAGEGGGGAGEASGLQHEIGGGAGDGRPGR